LNAWRGVQGIDYPLARGAPGHESWGEAVELGRDVRGLRRGQVVTGLLWNGLAEFGVARAADLVAIEGPPLLGEPLACAMNVVRRAAIEPGQRVAFVGFGYLAALCALVLPARTPWLAITRHERGRALASQLGAHAAHDLGAIPVDLWDSIPVVIEAAGVQQTLDFATWLTAPRGRLVIAGYHADGPRTVNMQSWNWKGIDVINAHERDSSVLAEGLRAGLELVAERGLNPSALVTHEFALDEVEAAFAAAEERPPGFVKAIVRP
jgi:threonine dehydrogenase-like Zn-dependent dehydrogenase